MSNNSQSKSLALMFLLGAFITGGALGFVAKGAMATTKAPEVRTGPSRELAQQLNLSDAQAAAIDTILRWRSSRDREAVKPVKHLMIANRDSARVLMMQKLTPEQQVKFKALLEETRIANEKKKNQQDSR
jgi:hypothetical protein